MIIVFHEWIIDGHRLPSHDSIQLNVGDGRSRPHVVVIAVEASINLRYQRYVSNSINKNPCLESFIDLDSSVRNH